MDEIDLGWQHQAVYVEGFGAAPQPNLCHTSSGQPTTALDPLPAPILHKGNPLSEKAALQLLQHALRPKASASGKESAQVSEVERDNKGENVFAAVVSGQCQ